MRPRPFPGSGKDSESPKQPGIALPRDTLSIARHCADIIGVMDAVRAFVFDVGNTLWFEAKAPDMMRIAELEAAELAPLLDEWRIKPREPLPLIIAEIWDAYLAAWQDEMDRGRCREPSLPFLIRGAMAVRGIELSDEQAQLWWRTAWLPSTAFGLQLYPDTLDVLRALKVAGLTIAVNTNRPCTGETFIETGASVLGFAEYIDVAVTSCDTGFLKPHPSTFELVLERLGLPPEQVAMVGDMLHADIEPAKALGMRTIWKLNGRYDLPSSTAADYAVHDLNEILSLPLLGEFAAAAGASRESPWPHDDDNADRY
jgi:HAD superfamily hydrolase (TIGR01509 family)